MAAKSKTLAAKARNQVNAYIKTLVDGSGSQILPRTWAKAVMTESGVTAEAKFAEITGELGGISSTVAKARPNIIGTYPVAEGETIAAGDVVDVKADGSVGKTVTPLANVETVVYSDWVTSSKVIKLNDRQSVCVMCTRNTAGNVFSAFSYLLKADINGVSVESGPSLQPGTSNATGYAAAARLSDTKFVAGYVGATVLYAQVGTVSGTAITLGSQFQLSAATTTYNALIPLSEAAFLSVYNRSGLKAKVFPVSGTTITTTAGEVSLPGNTSAAYISATPLPDDANGNKRVCVCFADGSDGNKGKAAIATISSANAVTWGTVVTFSVETTYDTDCCTNSGDVVILYKGMKSGNSQLNAQVLSISGTTITPNDFCEVSRGSPSDISIASIHGKLICVANLPSSYGGPGARVLSRDGNSIVPKDIYPFNGSSNAPYAGIAEISDTRFLVAYADEGNSNYGTVTMLEVFGDRIAGSFVDESSQCIALQSGEAGQEIEVIFDGVAELPGAAAGQTIVSPGVYGVGVLPGVLQVWSKDRPGQVVTGSYVGTGSYGASNPNQLTFDFPPKVLFIELNGGGGRYRAIVINPITKCLTDKGDISSAISLTWSGNSVSWYSSRGASLQLNNPGSVYYYTAIC